MRQTNDEPISNITLDRLLGIDGRLSVMDGKKEHIWGSANTVHLFSKSG